MIGWDTKLFWEKKVFKFLWNLFMIENFNLLELNNERKTLFIQINFIKLARKHSSRSLKYLGEELEKIFFSIVSEI